MKTIIKRFHPLFEEWYWYYMIDGKTHSFWYEYSDALIESIK